MPDKRNSFSLINNQNKNIRITLKSLYQLAFGEEFSIDFTCSLRGEQWIQLNDIDNRYYISSYGRVKSYCGYQAKILKLVNNGKGYLRTEINSKKYLTHFLTAKYFVGSPEGKEVHHKDTCRYNNNYNNLVWLTRAEHHNIHI